MYKNIYKKFDDTDIEEYEFHPNEKPISISNIDVNKTEDIISFLLVNKILNITKITKKSDLYSYYVKR